MTAGVCVRALVLMIGDGVSILVYIVYDVFFFLVDIHFRV